MRKKDVQSKKSREKALLTFLKRTKAGKYAKVDEKSSSYARLREQRVDVAYEDEYYYSVR